MSAFLCSDLHIAVCALAASRTDLTKASPKALMSAFRSINNAALAVRYGDSPVRMSYIANNSLRANKYLESHSVSDIAQLFNCLEYQCSEGDTMETHKVAKLLAKVTKYFNSGIIDNTSRVWSI